MIKNDVSISTDKLESAKRRLVAELLKPSEIDQISGGAGPGPSRPFWQSFDRFVDSPPAPPPPG